MFRLVAGSNIQARSFGNRPDPTGVPGAGCLAIALLAALLQACSLDPQISRSSVDYNAAIEHANNNFLVANILRSRDRAPLYFTDVSQIHGSFQVSASTGLSLPFGAVPAANKYDAGTIGGAVQSAPSFDVAPLDTQEFTQGILAPLDMKVIKYFWDRPDYPKWLLANLFISKIETYWPKGQRQLQGDAVPPSHPGQALSSLPPSLELPMHLTLENDPDRPQQLDLFKRFIYAWVRPEAIGNANQASVQSYNALEPVGPFFPIAPDHSLDALVKVLPQISPALVLRRCATCDLPHQYRLYKPVPHIVICPPLDADLKRPAVRLGNGGVSSEACDKQEIVLDDAQKPGDPSAEPAVVIYQRSVEQIVAYLGAILRANEAAAQRGEAPSNPVGFYLYASVPQNAAFPVRYRGQDYFIGPYNGAAADEYGNYRGDYTLKILTLLNELMNLNKVAKDIPTTRTVQVNP